jgi:hypothetical protein
MIHAGLGETEEMFAWLERGYEERSGWMVYLKAEPRLKQFHAERGFQALLQKIGLDREHPSFDG